MFPFETRKISCEIACADPEGGYGVRPPPGKSHRNYPLDPPPWKKLLSPIEKVGPPLKPLKIIVFFEITIGHPL